MCADLWRDAPFPFSAKSQQQKKKTASSIRYNQWPPQSPMPSSPRWQSKRFSTIPFQFCNYFYFLLFHSSSFGNIYVYFFFPFAVYLSSGWIIYIFFHRWLIERARFGDNLENFIIFMVEICCLLRNLHARRRNLRLYQINGMIC